MVASVALATGVPKELKSRSAIENCFERALTHYQENSGNPIPFEPPQRYDLETGCYDQYLVFFKSSSVPYSRHLKRSEKALLRYRVEREKLETPIKTFREALQCWLYSASQILKPEKRAPLQAHIALPEELQDYCKIRHSVEVDTLTRSHPLLRQFEELLNEKLQLLEVFQADNSIPLPLFTPLDFEKPKALLNHGYVSRLERFTAHWRSNRIAKMADISFDETPYFSLSPYLKEHHQQLGWMCTAESMSAIVQFRADQDIAGFEGQILADNIYFLSAHINRQLGVTVEDSQAKVSQRWIDYSIRKDTGAPINLSSLPQLSEKESQGYGVHLPVLGRSFFENGFVVSDRSLLNSGDTAINFTSFTRVKPRGYRFVANPQIYSDGNSYTFPIAGLSGPKLTENLLKKIKNHILAGYPPQIVLNRGAKTVITDWAQFEGNPAGHAVVAVGFGKDFSPFTQKMEEFIIIRDSALGFNHLNGEEFAIGRDVKVSIRELNHIIDLVLFIYEVQ
jgi:hypothetical protein